MEGWIGLDGCNNTASSVSQMMEDFSGLALPPLFGEHILEAELEPGGVELGPGEVTIMTRVTVLLISASGITFCQYCCTKSVVTSVNKRHGPVQGPF